MALEGDHNFHHAYYALPLSIPTALLVVAFVLAATRQHRAPHRARLAFVAVIAVTTMVRTRPFFPSPGFDADRVEAALPRLAPKGLAVVTDRRTPVVSLVVLRRTGWSAHPDQLTPERIEEHRRKGAKVLIESSFGGWLPEAVRAGLPQPTYADDQVRAYALTSPE